MKLSPMPFIHVSFKSNRPIVPMDNVANKNSFLCIYSLTGTANASQNDPVYGILMLKVLRGGERIVPHNPCEGIPLTQLLDPLPYRNLPHHHTECTHVHDCWLAATHSILLSHQFHFLHHLVLSF